MDSTYVFLKELCETPSPSGDEVAAASVLRSRLADVSDTVETDLLGSVHATLKGTGTGPTVMLAAHIDEIGFMVTHIDDSGFLYFDAVGGVDAAVLPGMRLDVHASSGELRGVVGRKPIHLIEADNRKTVTPLDKLFIDIGMSAEEARSLVRIGDTASFGVGFEELGNGFAVSRSFDDKVGAFIAVRVLEEVASAGGAEGDLVVAGTVQEEIGMRGGETTAYGVNPLVGIAVEVGHATDYPDTESDRRKHGFAKCGAGPIIGRGPNINPVLFDRLVAAAENEGVPYQIGPETRGTGTDANAIQLSRGGKVAGLVSIPLRYMHTPTEVLSLADVDAAIRLLTRFVLDLGEDTDFTPMPRQGR